MLIAIFICYCTCSVSKNSNSFTIIIKAFDKGFNSFRNERSAYKNAGYKILHLTSIRLKRLFMNRSA